MPADKPDHCTRHISQWCQALETAPTSTAKGLSLKKTDWTCPRRIRVIEYAMDKDFVLAARNMLLDSDIELSDVHFVSLFVEPDTLPADSQIEALKDASTKSNGDKNKGQGFQLQKTVQKASLQEEKGQERGSLLAATPVFSGVLETCLPAVKGSVKNSRYSKHEKGIQLQSINKAPQLTHP
ncbi:hypothetical protein VTN00DRAFT_5831 [Thermoascus crustaceus]|uniref:uncharacterized protein n=1 Tax=Thermoascus crustaceus TaxID=5088 RepID=UPI003743EE3B